MQKQVPFEDDKQESKCNDNGNRQDDIFRRW
jgi:hypothetical protein